MKVAVLNYTGSVGKTTLATHMLAPRMNNAEFFSVETINTTGEDNGVSVDQMQGKDFKEIFRKLMVLDDAIVDVGVTNIEAFLNGMLQFEDSHLEFDYFVLPVIPGPRFFKETMNMMATLSELQIPSEKVRILFNKVEVDAQSEFAPLFNFVKKEKIGVANPEAAVYDSQLYDMLLTYKTSIDKVLADETDYRTKAREANKEGNTKLFNEYSNRHAMKSVAKTVNRQLDTAFQALFS